MNNLTNSNEKYTFLFERKCIYEMYTWKSLPSEYILSLCEMNNYPAHKRVIKSLARLMSSQQVKEMKQITSLIDLFG